MIMIVFRVVLHSNRMSILHFYVLYVKFYKTAGFILIKKTSLRETRTDVSKVFIHFKTHLIFIWNFIHWCHIGTYLCINYGLSMQFFSSGLRCKFMFISTWQFLGLKQSWFILKLNTFFSPTTLPLHCSNVCHHATTHAADILGYSKLSLLRK